MGGLLPCCSIPGWVAPIFSHSKGSSWAQTVKRFETQDGCQRLANVYVGTSLNMSRCGQVQGVFRTNHGCLHNCFLTIATQLRATSFTQRVTQDAPLLLSSTHSAPHHLWMGLGVLHIWVLSQTESNMLLLHTLTQLLADMGRPFSDGTKGKLLDSVHPGPVKGN
jgi:hypothetical protein